MSDEITRNEKLFLKVHRETIELKKQLTRAERLLSFVEGGNIRIYNMSLNSMTTKKREPEVYKPIDFTVEADDVLALFAPAFDLFDEHFDRLVRYTERLRERIASNDKLIEAFNEGKDILIAKLEQDGEE